MFFPTSWRSPEGLEFYVQYIADASGYRVLDSNAVPVTVFGVRADGNQGAFQPSKRRTVVATEEEAIIPEQDLQESIIPEQDLQESTIPEQDLEESIIAEEDLEESIIAEEDLEESIILEKDLEESIIAEEDLEESIIPEKDLQESIIPEQDLTASTMAETVVRKPVKILAKVPVRKIVKKLGKVTRRVTSRGRSFGSVGRSLGSVGRSFSSFGRSLGSVGRSLDSVVIPIVANGQIGNTDPEIVSTANLKPAVSAQSRPIGTIVSNEEHVESSPSDDLDIVKGSEPEIIIDIQLLETQSEDEGKDGTALVDESIIIKDENQVILPSETTTEIRRPALTSTPPLRNLPRQKHNLPKSRAPTQAIDLEDQVISSLDIAPAEVIPSVGNSPKVVSITPKITSDVEEQLIDEAVRVLAEMMKLNVIEHVPLQPNVADKPAITDDTVGESVDSSVQSADALPETTNLDEVRQDTNELLSEGKPEFDNAKLLEREPELLEREPELLEREPELIEREPELLEREPELLEREPELLEREPELLEREPELPEREPELPELEPELPGESIGSDQQTVIDSVDEANSLIDDLTVNEDTTEPETDIEIEVTTSLIPTA